MTPQADEPEKELVQKNAQAHDPPDDEDDDDREWPPHSVIAAECARIQKTWSPEKERARRTFHEDILGIPEGAAWYYDRADLPVYAEADFR